MTRKILHLGWAMIFAIIKTPMHFLPFRTRLTNTHRKLAEFTVKQRLASVFGWRDYVEADRLKSYGPNHDVLWKCLAVYTERF